VVWGYSTPTRWQQWKEKAMAVLTGRSLVFNRVLYTNFSNEIAL